MRCFAFLRLLTTAVWLSLPTSVLAMDFTLIGDTLVLTGSVADTDLAKTKDSLDPGKVKLIVLHNNKGGDLWNALRIGERVRESGIPTTVSGVCQSACGLIFLGGSARTFSDGIDIGKTTIGLHGAHNRQTKEAMTTEGPKIIHYIETMTGGRYPKELMAKTVYTRSPSDFVFAFHPQKYTYVGTPAKKGIVECIKGADDKYKCAILRGYDAINVGIITSLEITLLDEKTKEFISSQ